MLGVFAASCSRVDNVADESSKVPDDQLSVLKEYSLLHSQGLNSCFDQLNSTLMNSQIPDLSHKNIANLVCNFVEEEGYALNSSTRSSLDSYDCPDETEVYALSPEAEQILNDYFTAMTSSSSSDEMESYIEGIIATDAFKNLDSDEQPLLLFMMLIGIDSAQYWTDPSNMGKWLNLSNSLPTADTKGTAGPGVSYWMTPEQMQDPRLLKVVKADVKGCLLSLCTGFAAVDWAICGTVGSVDAIIEIANE